MRWLRDLVLLLALAAIGLGLTYWQITRAREREAIQKASSEAHRLELEVRYRAATKAVDLNARGWPKTVDPGWFDRGAPVNPLLTGDHPWVEVAPPEDAELLHPPVRVALKEGDAMFWYNPHQGTVRARVPLMVTDQAALEMYNKVNACALPSLYWDERPSVPKASTVSRPAITDTDQQAASDPPVPAAKPASKREPTVVIVKRTPPKP